MEDKELYTPMMQQYINIKQDYADAIVFFRLGDFYEMFFDDAIVASKVLEITLTSKDAGKKVPMCGIPYHASKVYIQRLVSKGFKIAIAEQVSLPGKGLVEREVIKLITPGMIIDEGILNANEYNFIGSIILSEHGYVLSYADISTGDTFVIDGLSRVEIIDEIKNLKLKEVILSNTSDQQLMNFFKSESILVTEYKIEDEIHSKLIQSLSSKEVKLSASLLLDYLTRESKLELSHLMPFKELTFKSYMHIDHQVFEHLELIESNSKNPKSSLIYWLDQTLTAMGSRLLKYTVTHPLKDATLIEYRYDMIESFKPFEPRNQLESLLDQMYDINRLVGRIASNNGNAKDLVQLKNTLSLIPELKNVLSMYPGNLILELNKEIDTHETLYEKLQLALKDDAPLSIKEGGMIKDGYHHELDELREIALHGEDWLENFLETEREKTGIKNLKIGYNRVFGYYIEVSKGNIPLIQDEFGYIRKQTLTNGERYITESLKVVEQKLLTSKERADKLEYELFVELKEFTKGFVESLQKLSYLIAQMDMYLALAKVTDLYHYVRPKLNLNGFVEIESGRHPVVERHVEFISNHITMKPHEIFILTGPNMSGKSTYMRMFALIVIMAQSGIYVPANRASLPIYDAIFTRIGSSDDISGGKSTFMVEMVEANEALTKATKNSLILFDEIGRGTATYDGLALAQGMIEYIHKHIQAQTMFSTHYHELTQLSEKFEHITNLHVKAKEEKDHMVFLHQVERGASDKSYGIQVAALAHLPEAIIKRSKQILKVLEKESSKLENNLFMFEEKVELEHIIPKDIQNILDDLTMIDLDKLTPIDALIKLKYIQNQIKQTKKDS